MPEQQKRNVKPLAISVAVFILCAVVYVLVLGLYQSEDVGRTTVFAAEQGAAPDHVEIKVKVMSIDPVKGDMIVRLQFEPQNDLLGPDGLALSKTLVFVANSAVGKSEHIFRKGERMNPLEVTLTLFGGAVSDYPFDSHEAMLALGLGAPLPAAPAAPADALPEYERIPIVVNYTGALTGYRIGANESSEQEVGYCEINMIIARSLTVISFAIFIMLIQALLALSALAVMLSVVVGGRKVELGMFSWLAALLFALPPLRNLMPNAPPLGSLPDFLSFFWAEELVAISLICIVFTWLRRPGTK